MPGLGQTTAFLPAERASEIEIQRLRAKLPLPSLLKTIIDGIPTAVLLLNDQRQILLANQALLESRGLEQENVLIGLRPGEAFGCVNAHIPLGCGTTEFCKYCGAAQVLADCQMGNKAARECRITTGADNETESLDFLVWGTPFEWEKEKYLLFSLCDITHKKRRRVLEKIFFHDVFNTAAGLRSFAEILMEEAPSGMESLTGPILEASEILVNEIESQKQLQEAEAGELKVGLMAFRTKEYLGKLLGWFSRMEAARGRRVAVDANYQDIEIVSDPVLLNRAYGNLIKNALEASQPGQTVTIGCNQVDGRVEFWVHNQTEIPEDVQRELFKKSYSTKGHARGLGLYGAKLLMARYLNGRVSFSTSPEAGTVFKLELPLTCEC